ncbi:MULTISPECIES: CCC motif membrane protein [Chryseobacterium]|jgi:Ca2+/Na+ antiporter|uniref:CCC motif membrane protein n=1 Tax=Chryseobacterium TaxID=59732 RepID=UPI000493982A|nr:MULTISPECIES: CCC motif membrane protein [Chryseobacterium]MDR6158412.1 Ca2+/Na+ antiporter [Chryseobacterium sp. SLBN-27]
MDQQKLPNATAVLILGIVSIVGCCCYSIPGLIAGIIALVLAKKDGELYKQNPTMYSNYGQLNAGKIMAIIGIILSILYAVYIVVLIATVGWDAMKDPQLMQERMKELLGQ